LNLQIEKFMAAANCSVVIKFGGSVLTDKSQLEHVNHETFAACVKLASQLPDRACIVHGAGSFGHFHAARYQVKAGVSVADDIHVKRQGFSETRRSVLQLNSMLFSALIDSGRPSTPVHPMDSWTCQDSEFCSAEISCVHRCLDLGILPVLHGDVVFDGRRGFTVLSGDDIVEQLSKSLRPSYVVFVSDVPGVYMAAPQKKDPADSSFIHLCTVDSSGCITKLQCKSGDSLCQDLLAVGGGSGTDTTGGLPSQRNHRRQIHL
jgi:isopentenyl phosphate kinase